MNKSCYLLYSYPNLVANFRGIYQYVYNIQYTHKYGICLLVSKMAKAYYNLFRNYHRPLTDKHQSRQTLHIRLIKPKTKQTLVMSYVMLCHRVCPV